MFAFWLADTLDTLITGYEKQSSLEQAEAGSIDAQIRLAMIYDQPNAESWYLKAARNGSEKAKNILCMDYKVCN